MKKLLLFVLPLVAMMACSGIDKEKLREDSLRRVDSIAVAEARAEEARQDSIRQDSIRMAEEEKANRLSITNFCEWLSSDKTMTTVSGKKAMKKLKELGFSQTGNKVTWQGVDDCLGTYIKSHDATYKREKYGYTITVKLSYTEFTEGGSNDLWLNEVKIDFPDSELKDAFLQTAQSNHFRKKSSSFYTSHSEDVYWVGSDIEVSGNRVTIKENYEC